MATDKKDGRLPVLAVLSTVTDPGGSKMKFWKLGLAPVAAVMMASVTPATANTLTFQGVTFETLASGNMLQLTITNALTGGTGNWTDIGYLKAFEIKGIGDVTGATLAGWSVNVDKGLSSNSGCTTGGTPGACFFQSAAIPLTDSMSFQIDFVGTNLSFDSPSLKVQFLAGVNDKHATGDLLSRTIPPIPEPEIYAMMGIGLGLLGWAARRRKLKEAGAT